MNTKRNLQMDVLRGIAILLVIGSHLELDRPSGGIVGGFARYWKNFGGFGVSLFFVLSGFLISGLLLSELQKHGHVSVARFLMRRGLKIYPPYFVFIMYLLAVPLIKAIYERSEVAEVAKHLFTSYWPNLLFLQNYVGLNPAGHTWSLSVEEHFYLVLPLLIAGLMWLKRPQLLLSISLFSTVFFVLVRCVGALAGDPYLTDPHRTMAATHLCIDGLFLGVSLRSLAVYRPELFARLRSWRIPLMMVAVLLLFVVPVGTLCGVPLYRILQMQMWAAAALFACAYHTTASDFGRMAPWVRRAAAPLLLAGVYSYSIYLWHVTVSGILGKAIVRLNWTTNLPMVWISYATVICIGTTLAGIAIARLVEWPVLRFRDRFFPSRS